MNFILRPPTAPERARLGGKAAALAALGEAGLPVPAWFAIMPDAFHASLGDTARRRLRVIYENTDGFAIAQADLQLRGPGEYLGKRQSGAHQAGKFAIHDQDFRLGMIEGEGEYGRIETRIQGVQNAAGHRNAVVTFQHRRGVRQHHRNRIAAGDAAPGQRARQTSATGIEIPVVSLQVAMNNGDAFGENRRRPRQKRQRGQRLKIRRITVEIPIIGRNGH